MTCTGLSFFWAWSFSTSKSCSDFCRSLLSLSCPAAWLPCRQASAALALPIWEILAGLGRCLAAWLPAEQPPTSSNAPASAQCAALGSCLPSALLSFQAGSSPQYSTRPTLSPLSAHACCCRCMLQRGGRSAWRFAVHLTCSRRPAHLNSSPLVLQSSTPPQERERHPIHQPRVSPDVDLAATQMPRHNFIDEQCLIYLSVLRCVHLKLRSSRLCHTCCEGESISPKSLFCTANLEWSLNLHFCSPRHTVHVRCSYTPAFIAYKFNQLILEGLSLEGLQCPPSCFKHWDVTYIFVPGVWEGELTVCSSHQTREDQRTVQDNN